MAVHPAIQPLEAEAEGSQVQGQPEQWSKTLLKQTEKRAKIA
jgi:hypothetical protein